MFSNSLALWYISLILRHLKFEYFYNVRNSVLQTDLFIKIIWCIENVRDSIYINISFEHLLSNGSVIKRNGD